MLAVRSTKQKAKPRLTDTSQANVLRHSLVGHFHSLGQSRRSEQGLRGMDSYPGAGEGMGVADGMTGLESVIGCFHQKVT